jgi:YVTN family beta-propeller protein
MRAVTYLAALLGLILAGVSTAGTLLVGNKSEASVSLIDLDSGLEVARAVTRAGPHEIAVSDDGSVAIVTNYGGKAPGSTLSMIAVESGRTVANIDLGNYTRPHGIVFMPGNRHVLVTAEGAALLLKIDIETRRVEAAIPTGQDVSHMLAFDDRRGIAYVANIASGSISIIDVPGERLLSTHESGVGAEGIALAQDARELWVTNRGEDTVSLFDADSRRLRKKLDVAGFPIRAEVLTGRGDDPRRILVTSARSGKLSIINAETASVARTIDLGLALRGAADGLFADAFGKSSIPIGIEIEPGGGRVWIAHAGADLVQELEVGTWRQLRLLPTGREPDAMAFSPVRVDTREVP